MGKMTVRRCKTCGELEFEDKMLDYNDHWFCSIFCKLKKEKQDDENLSRRSTVVPLKPR